MGAVIEPGKVAGRRQLFEAAKSPPPNLCAESARHSDLLRTQRELIQREEIVKRVSPKKLADGQIEREDDDDNCGAVAD
jgi:hypothetical protein